MADGTEPIDDDEILYRRIPALPNYYNPEDLPPVAVLAFHPRKEDETGLSIYRAKYKNIGEVAQNPYGKKYYVAVMRAGDLRETAIEVVPRPILPDDPGHAEIPSLNFADRYSQRAKEQKKRLAHELCAVEGPYP